MNSSHIFSIVTFIYGFAVVLYVAAWVFKKKFVGKLATASLMAAAVGNGAAILLRWFESYKLGYGHAPLSNLYESLVFFALVFSVLYLFVEFKYKIRSIGVVASPIPFLAIAYASLQTNSQIEPLIPALQSNWLIAHVMACFLGYAAFAVAFGISLLYLFKYYRGDRSSGLRGLVPDMQILDELTHKMITFGFLFLSVGIFTGSVWANQAWGRYWGWDPKETWSLITWLIYAAILHARLMRGWEGRRIAFLSVIGFMAVLFTYFGVNLLPGLHSYQ